MENILQYIYIICTTLTNSIFKPIKKISVKEMERSNILKKLEKACIDLGGPSPHYDLSSEHHWELYDDARDHRFNVGTITAEKWNEEFRIRKDVADFLLKLSTMDPSVLNEEEKRILYAEVTSFNLKYNHENVSEHKEIHDNTTITTMEGGMQYLLPPKPTIERPNVVFSPTSQEIQVETNKDKIKKVKITDKLKQNFKKLKENLKLKKAQTSNSSAPSTPSIVVTAPSY